MHHQTLIKKWNLQLRWHQVPILRIILLGTDLPFKDGYIDGCETAKRSAYGLKDEKRFAEESQYRNGWKDGYNLCLGKD